SSIDQSVGLPGFQANGPPSAARQLAGPPSISFTGYRTWVDLLYSGFIEKNLRVIKKMSSPR
ncbi:MAG: hypothetical protein ACHQX0_00535, partial [Desulfobaccales bacterium]